MFPLLPSIIASIRGLPILRLVQQISTYISSLLSSIAVIALYQCSDRSLLSGLIVPVFPFLSLLLIGRGLPSQCTQAYLPFKGPSLFVYISFLIYVLAFSIFFFYWVALYCNYFLYCGCVNIYVQQQNCRFTFKCSAQCSPIGPYSSTQVLILQLSQQRQGALCQYLTAQSQAPDLGTVQHYQPYNYYIQQAYKSK